MGLLTGCYPRRVGNHIWVHRADSATAHFEELTIMELLKANDIRLPVGNILGFMSLSTT